MTYFGSSNLLFPESFQRSDQNIIRILYLKDIEKKIE